MLAERVVIGVDFSEAAESAARWAATRFVPEGRADGVIVHAHAAPHSVFVVTKRAPDATSGP